MLNSIITLDKNILIYPHQPFNINDGGTTVQYYLANVLSNLGINIKIYNNHDKNQHNILFNNFVNDINCVDFDNTVVIYCEGIVGNPLNAKYIIRWMLSKLGQNVPYEFYDTWNSNELVYFFNNEINMINHNINFKLLSLFYINPEINNINCERQGLCYSIRKRNCFDSKMNVDITTINSKFNSHNLQPFEITRNHTQHDYINIFNKHEYFISYDPLTFLNIIAAMCGCVSIVYPLEGVTKHDYFKMTPFYQYMVENNCFEIYGLAYGITDEEIFYSKNTLKFAKQQLIDINNWLINKYVTQFIVDLNNWDTNYNILQYYKYSMCENIDIFDVEFYKSVHKDLSHFSIKDATKHYCNHGKNEKRLLSKKHFYTLYPDFDIEHYKSSNPHLNNMSDSMLLHHYYFYFEEIKRQQILFKKYVEYYCNSFNIFFDNTTNESFYNIQSKIYNLKKSQLDEFKLLNHIKLINNEALIKIKQNLSSLTIDNKISNPDYNNLYLSWLNKSINERKISIVSPISRNIIYTDKYFITNNLDDENTNFSICNYYFDDEKILLGLGVGTGNHPQEAHILYVYCLNEDNILYEWYNYSFEKFKNILLFKILLIFENIVKKYNFELIDSKITTIYGYMHNMGHMLFNEYTGLYLIDYLKITTKIDEIVFGNHDVYYIKKYFQQFKNINIIDNDDIINIEKIGKGVFFKYNDNHILDDTIVFLKNNLDKTLINNDSFNYQCETKNAALIKKKHYPIFNIVLRKGDFEMNNQTNTISNLINLLTDKYPNAFFYLDGFVNNNENNVLIGVNHNLCKNKIINDYLELVNEIIKKINTQNFINLINVNILHLITHIQNCNYGIYILGSATCNSAWICRIPGIQFGRPNIEIYKNMDKLIRENMPNIVYLNNCVNYCQNCNFDITAETIFNLIPIF